MKQYDVEYFELESGAIRLKQDAYGGDDVVDLHPAQLRQIAEHFGLVTANHPDSELSKQLAEQLCRVYHAMAGDYRHLSQVMEEEYTRIDGFISAMPDSVFPHHLWEERAEREATEAAKREVEQRATSDERGAGNANPSADSETAAAGQQLGLEV